MSTGISEQRVKGPGNQVNGPKDHGKIKERVPYETAWHPQVHQQPGYNNAITPEQYYQYPNVTPYQYPTPTAYNMGDRSWTNAPEAVTYIGGYLPTPEAYSQPNVYNAQYNHPNPAPGYNYYIAQKPYEGYYRAGDQVYGVPVNEQIKTVEQEVQALSVNNYRDTSNLQQKKVTTWASVAKQPVKPMISLTSVTKKKGPGMPPPPMIPGKNDGHWETKTVAKPPPPPVVQVQVPIQASVVQAPVVQAPVVQAPIQAPVVQAPVIQTPVVQAPVVQAPVVIETKAQNWNDHRNVSSYNPSVAEIPTHIPPPDHIRHVPPPPILMSSPPPPKAVTKVISSVEEKPKGKIIDELKMKNHYNPAEYSNPPEGSRFFVIKSYSEDDIHRSIKYEIWCSTDHGNRRLDQAFSSSEKKKIFLLYSVNGSGHFCGVAEMISAVDYNSSSSVWCQDKWKGQFGVRWIYVKDVPNTQLRHIRLENNENKSVTHSRDTQEVPYNQGVQVLRIIHSYKHETSIFDDFQHYENLQKLEDNKKSAAPPPPSSHSTINKHNQNGPIQFSSENRPQHNYFNRDWESKQKPTKIEDMENSYHPQRLENFNHNNRSRNDNHRGRNENHNKEDNFREKGEHHRNHRSDQNKTRNDQHRNWDDHYRGGNNYNRGRRGRGGPSVFVNSNLKQARGNESKD